MAKRQNDRQHLLNKIDSLEDGQIQDLLEYISKIESTNRTPAPRSLRDDDLIAMLADAHENRRARQAFEWEAVRRRAERRAITLSTRP